MEPQSLGEYLKEVLQDLTFAFNCVIFPVASATALLCFTALALRIAGRQVGMVDEVGDEFFRSVLVIGIGALAYLAISVTFLAGSSKKPR